MAALTAPYRGCLSQPTYGMPFALQHRMPHLNQADLALPDVVLQGEPGRTLSLEVTGPSTELTVEMER